MEKRKRKIAALLVFAMVLVGAWTPTARGIEKSPPVIKVLNPQNAQIKITDKFSSDWWLVYFTAGLVIVGLTQILLFFWQLVLIRASLIDAKISADAAKDGAQAAKDSADAMKNVATIIDKNGRKQMRAYLSIITGNCFPQNREKNTKYEIRIFIKNTGFTPAHAVYCAFRIKIFPFPLPEDVDLSLPPAPVSETAGHIATGQHNYFTAWLDDFISDETIEEIKGLRGKALYLYGTVKYKDVWGESCYTNFCQMALWDSDGNYNTLNVNRHNDAG
ncbi:MAG TPA: hypothetical protein VMV79_02935 [Alphaproteobacteria bacterium]|nr:hypothetical protein [Alphaproteobacteria bacterium]